MPAPDLISSTLCFASASVVSTEVAAEPGAGWLDEITQTGKNKINKKKKIKSFNVLLTQIIPVFSCSSLWWFRDKRAQLQCGKEVGDQP